MRQTLPWRRCTPALIWSDANELLMSQSVWSLRETSQINQWGSWKTQKWEEVWTKVVKEEQRQKWKLCDDEHVTNLKLRRTALKPRCSLGVWSWNSSVFVWKERRKSAAADSNRLSWAVPCLLWCCTDSYCEKRWGPSSGLDVFRWKLFVWF